MFAFSGFDPALMSDDELLQKTTDLHAKLVYAGRFGSAEMISGLQRILEVVEHERSQRVMRTFARDRALTTPDVIESDPDLARIGRDEPSPERGKIVPQKKPRPMMQISARPTSDL